jgi:hypothetical protein
MREAMTRSGVERGAAGTIHLAPTAVDRPRPRGRLGGVRALCCLVAAAAAVFAAAAARAQDPFADAVTAFTVGSGGGFGSGELPGIVLGPPRGGGALQQSLHVVALGNGGEIVLRFDLPVICDGPGPDFTVFENAFHANSPQGPIFEEFGFVSVSQDGQHFIEFPYDASSHSGLAGRVPVFSAPDNDIDPLDPEQSGGDAFDLAAVGLAWAAYVRIVDVNGAIPDPGDRIPPGDKGGFDLDAIAALHACDPNNLATATPTVTAVAPTPTSQPGATATATGSPPPGTSTPTATATPAPPPGDVDGDGTVSDADRGWLIAEIHDGDGDAAGAAGGGDISSGPGADVNLDGRITAADIAAVARSR